MRRRYTREQRIQLVELVTSGNATVVEAATKLGVGVSAAYNWVAESREVRRPSTTRHVAAPTFVRLVPSAGVAEQTGEHGCNGDFHHRRVLHR